MAFTPFETSTTNISTLSDRPNQNDGLSSAQLKGRFDKAGNDIKTYLNDVLLEELKRTTDGDSGADNIGATAVGDGTATTVQSILEEIDADVTALDGAAVHKTGNETIEDTKTFTASPIVPMPTAGEHAVCRDYIESITSTSLSETTPGKLLDATMGKEIWDGLISRTAFATEDRNAIWSDLNEHRGETDNPHEVTAAQIGALPTTDAGDLAELTTTEKGSLVGAINELNTDKIETSAIANTLTETGTGKVLDARQGKAISDKIGNQSYTEKNYIADGESATSSINKLDMGLKDTAELVSINSTKTDITLAAATAEIKSLQLLLQNANVNQEARQQITDAAEVVSLPKTAGNGGMPVVLGGMTAKNEVVNGDFSQGTTGWAANVATISAANKELTMLAIATGAYCRSNSVPYTANHKLYVKASVKADSNLVKLTFGEENFSGNSHSGNGQYENISGIFTYSSSVSTHLRVQDGRTSGWTNVYAKNVFLCNLTTTFGSGSEPDLATCDKLFATWFDGLKSVVAPRVRSVDADGDNPSYLYPEPVTLRRVPNGTRDTIEGGNLVRRVSKYILQVSDVVAMDKSDSQLDWARVIRPADFAYKTVGYYEDFILEGYATMPSADNAANIGTVTGKFSSGLYVGFVKGTTLEQAKTALVGKRLIHQTSTTTITEDITSGLLTSNPSGTVYLEHALADAGMYTDKLTVLRTDFTIERLETIHKVDPVTGGLVPLSIATAVIASDGLGFTHPELTAGDIVFFVYHYPYAGPFGENTYSVYDSRYVIADSSNGKYYKWQITSANGVPSIGLVEV